MYVTIPLCLSFVSEMRPCWFKHANIPFDSMWPDDHLWYPIMLNDGYFDACFKFQGISKMLDYSITPRVVN